MEEAASEEQLEPLLPGEALAEVPRDLAEQLISRAQRTRRASAGRAGKRTRVEASSTLTMQETNIAPQLPLWAMLLPMKGMMKRRNQTLGPVNLEKMMTWIPIWPQPSTRCPKMRTNCKT